MNSPGGKSTNTGLFFTEFFSMLHLLKHSRFFHARSAVSLVISGSGES